MGGKNLSLEKMAFHLADLEEVLILRTREKLLLRLRKKLSLQAVRMHLLDLEQDLVLRRVGRLRTRANSKPWKSRTAHLLGRQLLKPHVTKPVIFAARSSGLGL